MYRRRFQDAMLPGQEQLRAVIAERRIEWLTDLGGVDASFAKKDPAPDCCSSGTFRGLAFRRVSQ